jgi:hypothetical protein
LSSVKYVEDHGGRVLDNSKIQIIFWGKKWETSSSKKIFRNQIKFALCKIFVSDYFIKLNQYRDIHKPSLLKIVTNTVSKAPDSFSDRHMQHAIVDLILNKTVAYDHDTAFILIPTEDMKLDCEDPEIVDGGHDFFSYKLRYDQQETIVTIPFGYIINFNDIDQITLTITHEIVEIVTNPEYDGIYGHLGMCKYAEDQQCELADICETSSDSVTISNTLVSKYWSNIDQKCVPS